MTCNITCMARQATMELEHWVTMGADAITRTCCCVSHVGKSVRYCEQYQWRRYQFELCARGRFFQSLFYCQSSQQACSTKHVISCGEFGQIPSSGSKFKTQQMQTQTDRRPRARVYDGNKCGWNYSEEGKNTDDVKMGRVNWKQIKESLQTEQ